jgi:hypothetical protein
MLLAWGSLADRLRLGGCRTRGPLVSTVRFGLQGLLVAPAAVVVGRSGGGVAGLGVSPHRGWDCAGSQALG